VAAAVNTAVPGMRYAWNEVKTLAVVDDNHLPYLSIPADGGSYSAKDIDAFIVALAGEGFLSSGRVSTSWCQSCSSSADVIQLPPEDQTIIRYFITTGSAFRRFVRSHESEFDPKLVEAVMKLPFAQFLWIVEFATESQWASNQIQRGRDRCNRKLDRILPVLGFSRSERGPYS